MNDRRRHYSSRPSTVSQSHTVVEETAHGRTSGPVYFLRNDDEWVLGELVITDQWVTFEGSSAETVSHPTGNITAVGALDFFNYFESNCFELHCVLPPPPTSQRSKALSSARYAQQQSITGTGTGGTDSNTTNLTVLSSTNLREHVAMPAGRPGPSPTSSAPPAIFHGDEDGRQALGDNQPHHSPVLVSSGANHDRLIGAPYISTTNGRGDNVVVAVPSSLSAGGLGPLAGVSQAHFAVTAFPNSTGVVEPTISVDSSGLYHVLALQNQNNSNDNNNNNNSNKSNTYITTGVKHGDHDALVHPQLRVEGQQPPHINVGGANSNTLGVSLEGILGGGGSLNVPSLRGGDGSGALASPSGHSPQLLGASGQSVASNLNATLNVGMSGIMSPVPISSMSMAANAGSLQSPHAQPMGGGVLSAAGLAAAGGSVFHHHNTNANPVNSLSAQNLFANFARSPSMGGGLGIPGRISPVNSMSAVRGAQEGLSVTPVLSPALSLQDIGGRQFMPNSNGALVDQHGLGGNTSSQNPNNLSLPPSSSPTTTGPSPTSGGFYTFPLPPTTQQATEKIVFKALSLNDMMMWLSAFDMYLDLGVLTKCGITISSNTLEPSDEFGRLYKAFPAYGGRLPDPPMNPNAPLLDDNWGHELIDYKTKV